MADFDTLPAHVREALGERGISPERTSNMTGEEIFREYCQWHGLFGWSGTLWSVVMALKEKADD